MATVGGSGFAFPQGLLVSSIVVTFDCVWVESIGHRRVGALG
jgi:hypothetical protein